LSVLNLLISVYVVCMSCSTSSNITEQQELARSPTPPLVTWSSHFSTKVSIISMPTGYYTVSVLKWGTLISLVVHPVYAVIWVFPNQMTKKVQTCLAKLLISHLFWASMYVVRLHHYISNLWLPHWLKHHYSISNLGNWKQWKWNRKWKRSKLNANEC